MSNVQPKQVKVVSVDDPVTEWSDTIAVVERYAPSKDYFRVATSDFSQSNISWLINTNSAEAFIDRGFIAEVKVRFTINSVARPGSRNCLSDGAFSLRSNPLNSGLLNMSLKCGNVITSLPISECLPALERMLQPDGSKYIGNIGPTMVDQFKYFQAAAGSSRNSISPYSQLAFDCAHGRGAIPYTVISNTPTQAVIEYVLYEQLFLSPLINNLKQQATGFTHITQLQLQLQFRSNACEAMFNIYNGALDTNPYLAGSFQVMAQPILHVCQLLDPLKVSPSVTSYPLFDTNRYVTNFNLPQTPLSTVSVTTNVLQLANIPRYCVIYAIRNFNNLGIDEARAFAPIQSLAINFNNVQYLTQADTSQLFKMSVQNGLQSSFVNFTGIASTGVASNVYRATVQETAGAPIVLQFGKDIPLSDASICVSTATKCNLQITAQIRNNDKEDYDWEPQLYDYSLYVMLINDVSISTYGANSGSIATSLFTPLDCLNARKHSATVKYTVFNNRPFGAGGSCDMTGKYDDVKALKDRSGKEEVNDMNGEGLVTINRAYQGAGRSGGRSGGGNSGGAKMSKEDLKRMLLE